MANIYRDAAQVLVWLGPESGDSELAFQTIIQTVSNIETQGLDSVVSSEELPPEGSTERESLLRLIEDFLEIMRGAEGSALSLLAERSWWSRVWVRKF